MGGFDASNVLRHAERLATPRLSGTEGERAAGKYIREEQEKFGFGVTAEQFSCSEHVWVFVRISLGLISLAFLTGSIIRDFDPGMAIAVSGFPFVLAILALRGLPWILNSFSDHPSIGPESFNLVTDRLGEGRHKVYFNAHYDSKGQGI